jgi:hypothetical protein
LENIYKTKGPERQKRKNIHNTALEERRGWESPLAAREDQAPPLEDLSPTEATGSCREPPTTGPGEGWREKRDHYAPERETNSLACACHALMRGRRER